MTVVTFMQLILRNIQQVIVGLSSGIAVSRYELLCCTLSGLALRIDVCLANGLKFTGGYSVSLSCACPGPRWRTRPISRDSWHLTSHHRALSLHTTSPCSSTLIVITFTSSVIQNYKMCYTCTWVFPSASGYLLNVRTTWILIYSLPS